MTERRQPWLARFSDISWYYELAQAVDKLADCYKSGGLYSNWLHHIADRLRAIGRGTP